MLLPDTKFPMVPLGTKRAASLQVSSAILACNAGEKKNGIAKDSVKETECLKGRIHGLYLVHAQSFAFNDISAICTRPLTAI